MKRKNLVGQKFGMLTVTADAGGKHWHCICDCGGQKRVLTVELNTLRTRSCGCLRRTTLSLRNEKHGYSGTKTHRSWKDMRQRCLNPNNDDFRDYGGRGIAICDRWSEFTNFLADMGERPPGKSLDRKDVNGGYSPENCRWADDEMQANNKRNTRLIEIDGTTATLAQWCRKFNIDHTKVRYRIKIGMPLDMVFSSQDFRKC